MNSPLRRIWLVARQEFLSNIRKRSFLFAAIGAPLISIVMMIIVIAASIGFEGDASNFSMVGVVDNAGIITQYDDPTASYEVTPVPMFVRYADELTARAALDAEAINAFIVVGENYRGNGQVTLYTSAGVPDVLTSSIDMYLRENVGADVDPAVLRRVIDPTRVALHFLNTGRTVPIDAVFGLLFTPIIFIVVFMIAAQTTSGYLMSGVVEEKTNRIMEILITTITPFQLLAGKIVGLGLLGLLQFVIWGVLAVVVGAVANTTESALLSAIYIPPDMAVLMAIYLILGYFFLATTMAGIGAVVGSEQESRQTAGVFNLVLVVPFFAFVSFIIDPNGSIPTALSLFPLTAPSAMVIRLSFTTVPPEQVVLSIILLILTNLLVLWISARIFRFALLMTGKRLNIRQIAGLFRRRGGMVTVAAGERGTA